MANSSHITLIGFMGTGKSTVARLLAERLGWDLVDGDLAIIEKAGKPIPEIFAAEGEMAFRKLETQTYTAIRGQSRVVVAAGGGAILLPETRRAIADAGLVVCLEASPETIAARLAAASDDERPLLSDTNVLPRIRRLKAQRAALYAQVDLTINTDVLTPGEVVDQIAGWRALYGEKAVGRPGRVEALSATPAIVPPIVDAPGAAAIVRTVSGEYPAYVEWGALDRLGEYTKRATGARRAFLISDENVIGLWGEAATGSLREAGIEVHTYTVEPGDATKSMEAAAGVYDWLASQKAERRDVVIGLGGGMVTDFAGYIAATYLRGMAVVQAPTSLLGMVDAAIGGKTAINHAGAKNIVGAFWQPKAVVADVATLKTLPHRALIEGMGEVVKHAFIRDAELLETLEMRLDDLMALEPELTTKVVARNIQIKAAVVSEDERETGGVRELLNYGHTLGHAFEAAGGYEQLLHGEAVSVGMMAAAEIGQRIGVTPESIVHRQRRLLERYGMPLLPPKGLDPDRVRAALSLDKKIVAGGQRWILLEDVGKPIVTADVPREVVEAVMNEFLSQA
ncbi:MAG: 3-dehydroquinate synthase [Dehalococcoidia bacterium]